MKYRILHLVDDEKFVDSAYEWAEKIIPDVSDFIVISDNEQLKHIKKTPVKIISKRHVFRFDFLKFLKSYNIVIIHKLDFVKLWFLFIAPRNVVFVWIGLGGDYYKYIYPNMIKMMLPLTKKIFLSKVNRRRNYFKEKFYQSFIAKRAISKVKYFAPVIEEDYRLLQKQAKWFNPKYIGFNYGSGINKISEILKNDPIDGNSILIGNSSTYENNHLDFFNKIEGYSLKQFNILCPLNYGRDEYRKVVLKEGEKIFGEKFSGLTEFLDFDTYTNLISTCSIVVMNHKRQQALGNINMMIAMGAKIYLRKENPVYDYLRARGYIIFAIDDIQNEQDFLRKLSSEEISFNRNTMKRLLDPKTFERSIENFYKKLLSEAE